MQFNGVIQACRGVRCDRLPPGGGNTQFQSFVHILLGWHISLWVWQKFQLYCKISWQWKVYNCTICHCCSTHTWMHTLQQDTWSEHNSHACLISPIRWHSPTLVYHLGSTKEQNYKLLNPWKKSGVKSCLSVSGSNFENPQTSRKSTKERLQGFSVVFFLPTEEHHVWKVSETVSKQEIKILHHH